MREKEEIKCNNIIKRYKNDQFSCYYKRKPKKKHIPYWPHILDHSYRILIIGGSGSGKINFLFNLINKEPYIDQVYSYAEDLYKTKYQFLISKRESTGLKHFNNSQAFIQYSNYINAIYKNHLRIESK